MTFTYQVSFYVPNFGPCYCTVLATCREKAEEVARAYFPNGNSYLTKRI